MSKKAVSGGNKLVAIIGDTDTVTGFLLTGIGDRNLKGNSNFLVVEPDTKDKVIEDTFNGFLKNTDIAVILVNQHIAEKYLRHLIVNHEETLPAVLEIPSKDKPYEPKKNQNIEQQLDIQNSKYILTYDTIMQRANKLLYGSEIA